MYSPRITPAASATAMPRAVAMLMRPFVSPSAMRNRPLKIDSPGSSGTMLQTTMTSGGMLTLMLACPTSANVLNGYAFAGNTLTIYNFGQKKVDVFTKQ